MAEYIEAATAPLCADKRAMEEELNAVNMELDSLFEEMQELDSMWDGPASQAFAAQFQKDYETMREIMDNLAEYVRNMQFAADEYDRCENHIAELVSAVRI